MSSPTTHVPSPSKVFDAAWASAVPTASSRSRSAAACVWSSAARRPISAFCGARVCSAACHTVLRGTAMVVSLPREVVVRRAQANVLL